MLNHLVIKALAKKKQQAEATAMNYGYFAATPLDGHAVGDGKPITIHKKSAVWLVDPSLGAVGSEKNSRN